jgi:hypothetical protein
MGVVARKQGSVASEVVRFRLRATPLAFRPRDQHLRMIVQDLAGARSRGAARATGVGGRGPPRNRRNELSHRPRHECWLASAQRKAWGVGGWGMAAARRRPRCCRARGEAEPGGRATRCDRPS